MSGSVDTQGPDELPLSLAAHETAYFEKPSILLQHGDIVLGKTLSEHPSSAAFGSMRLSATVRNFHLRHVVLDADSLVLLRDGKPIPETYYFVPDALQRTVRAGYGPLTRLPDAEDVVVACNRVHNHYQHWMTQCLPAIDWSLRERRSQSVRLVLPKLQPWQEDTLALLGYATVPRLEPRSGTRYFLPNAQYSEFLNGSTSSQVCRSVVATAAKLAEAVTPRPSPHRIVYVRCTDPYYGRIENEDEVVDFLGRQGAHICSPGNLPIDERIRLFQNAEVVIGAHGQELSDVLFCKPGALLWELMPRHYQNASYNRLAQAAGLDYWGDLFEPVEEDQPRDWHVDPNVLGARLKAIPQRLAMESKRPRVLCPTDAKPLDELMMEFENLGDNCEFGLVQRNAKSEPLGLLRFAGFFVPSEYRLEKLVSALDRGFEGLGAPETINLSAEGPNLEFIVNETAYNLLYHTFRHQGEIEADALRESEPKRLRFLRLKLLDDLASGEKIWIWKSTVTNTRDDVTPLLKALRRHGPNTLLWVVEADKGHPSGSVEQLESYLLKGYVARFAPPGNATEIDPVPWFEVCQRAYDICRATAGIAVATEEASTPSAMEYPADHPAGLATKTCEASLVARLRSWMRRMLVGYER